MKLKSPIHSLGHKKSRTLLYMLYKERVTSNKVKIVEFKHHVNAYVGRKDNRKGLKSFITTETIHNTSRGSVLNKLNFLKSEACSGKRVLKQF